MERANVRLRETVRGTVRIIGGGLRMSLGTVTGSLTHQARGRRTVSRGAGIVAGAYGTVYAEYARPASPHRRPRGPGVVTNSAPAPAPEHQSQRQSSS